MATPDKSLFHEVEDLNPSKEEQERIRRKQAVAKLQDSPAIQKQIRKARVAKDQVKVRDQSRKTNARLEAERKAKLKAKEDAKKNTVNYSDATKPKKTTAKDKPADTAKKFNVGVSKGGVPFKAAFKHYRDKGNKTFTWNGKKYTTKLDTETKPKGKTGSDDSKPKKKGFRPFGGAIRRALLGKDEKFGGDKGAIDFIRRKKKPKNKAGGGMMKSKMSSKGGKMGGKMAPGYNEGGEAKVKKPNKMTVLKDLMTIGRRKAQELHGKAAVNQAVKDLNKISGVTPTKKIKTEKEKKLAGADSKAAMTQFTKQTPAAKKQAQVNKTEKRLERGFKNGGMAKKTPKGYSKGGAARKSKPRGVGAALRGYGKAMR